MSNATARQAPERKLVSSAYFYADTYWAQSESNWIKTLLLFFDEISILLPRYMYGRHRSEDPFLAGPLEDQGLLKILEPGEYITQEMAEELATTVIDLIAAGAFDDLPGDEPTYFHDLSRTRGGWGVDAELSDWLFDELRAKGLAHESRDGVSVPLHPVVRRVILFLLSQIARRHGAEVGRSFQPISGWQPVSDIMSILQSERFPSIGHVVAMDIEHVALSLDTVPLDEVLAFRAERGVEFRSYTRDLREFTTQLSLIEDPQVRLERLVDRQSELTDRAADLRKSLLRRWMKPGGKMVLGLAGAAWNLSSGDPIGAFLNIGQAALEPPDTPTVEAYSYLVHAERSLSR